MPVMGVTSGRKMRGSPCLLFLIERSTIANKHQMRKKGIGNLWISCYESPTSHLAIDDEVEWPRFNPPRCHSGLRIMATWVSQQVIGDQSSWSSQIFLLKEGGFDVSHHIVPTLLAVCIWCEFSSQLCEDLQEAERCLCPRGTSSGMRIYMVARCCCYFFLLRGFVSSIDASIRDLFRLKLPRNSPQAVDLESFQGLRQMDRLQYTPQDRRASTYKPWCPLFTLTPSLLSKA